MRLLLGIFLFLASLSVAAQPSHLGSWNLVNTRLTLPKGWSIFNELQLRSQSFYKDYYYYEIKGGVAYDISKTLNVLLGAGHYKTFSNGGDFQKPVSADEFRTWAQLSMTHFLQRVKLEHRYRIEQRWFNNNTYRSRFRYRLNALAPLNAGKMGPGVFFLSVFDEIFLTNKTPYFERNRLFTGCGYQFSKNITVLPGYMRQFDYKNNTGTGKNFFLLALLIEVHAGKKS